MLKLYLDPGHGGYDPGASGNGLKEKNVVLDISLRIRNILQDEYNNVEVKMSRTTDTFVSLDERTNEANAWGADYFLSIHCNAYDGSAHGYEDYIYSGLSESSTTAQYQDILHKEITAVNQLYDRGQKQANFHVLRESVMPALLTENGFIDNSHDASLMKDPSWRQTVARGHVNGLASAFNLQKASSNTLYKVIAGSFKEKKNAEERVQFLHSKGIGAFIDPTYVSSELWYCVQAGAFQSKQNAENRVAELKKLGIKGAFITVDNGGETGDTIKGNTGYTIKGNVELSPEQMNQFAKSVNPNAPSLGVFYSSFGRYYGIRGDVAFAQALHETNYFRFTGVVDPKQNNYAGIGATGPDHPGASFQTPRDGVLAHIQHLYAYASTKPLPDQFPLVDPRFHQVKRGSAETWIGLNGKWAVPGNGYGQSILSNYEKAVKAGIQHLENILTKISN